ncbi:MAG: hydrolase [Enterobacterales bacterium]|nr:hydrolase [Enterobacterales bacterium]
MQHKFIAPWWAKSRHLQTIWSSLFRRLPALPPMRRKRIELDDGDFIDVDCLLRTDDSQLKINSPSLLLLHGLEGSIDSPYIRGMLEAAQKQDWQVFVMHFRSCSGEPNRLQRSYNSGVSDDLDEVVKKLLQQGINIDYIVGYSLGGNVLLKWLGEQKDKAPIKAAAAVSVPLMLDVCATEIHKGFSRLYEFALLFTLRRKTRQKIKQFGSELLPEASFVTKLNSFWMFDNHVTAPVHGYKNAEDYYQKASARQFVKHIQVPTLIIQAKDDPFMNHSVIPDCHETPNNVILEANENGGHVGFVDGNWPWQAEYYLERRIPEFLSQFNEQ